MKAMHLPRTQKDIQAFLDFPDRLYQPAYRTEKKQEVRQLLEERHVLSRYFSQYPLVVREKEQILARCILAFYPGDEAAYLGFFESLENMEAAAKLFALAEELTRGQGRTVLEGPMNVSFWLGYRLKTSHFAEEPYFTELYQPDYYQHLWEQNGFATAADYHSNRYAPVEGEMQDQKYQARYQQFCDLGYVLRSPSRSSFDHDFRAVTQMIRELFRTFPVYKAIRTTEFMDLFADLKKVLNYRYVKLAYDRSGRAAGFLVAIPNYGTLLNKEKLGMRDVLRMLYTKWTTREYILLYMGVRPGHEGLGSALVYSIMEEFRGRKIQAISSYIQAGKVSDSYLFPSVVERRSYRYYRKSLTPRVVQE